MTFKIPFADFGVPRETIWLGREKKGRRGGGKALHLLFPIQPDQFHINLHLILAEEKPHDWEQCENPWLS